MEGNQQRTYSRKQKLGVKKGVRQRCLHYGIRKFKTGIFSVAVAVFATSLVGGFMVQAVEASQLTPNTGKTVAGTSSTGEEKLVALRAEIKAEIEKIRSAGIKYLNASKKTLIDTRLAEIEASLPMDTADKLEESRIFLVDVNSILLDGDILLERAKQGAIAAIQQRVEECRKIIQEKAAEHYEHHLKYLDELVKSQIGTLTTTPQTNADVEIQKIQTLAVMQQFLDAITNTSPQQPPQIDPPKADAETPEQNPGGESPSQPDSQPEQEDIPAELQAMIEKATKELETTYQLKLQAIKDSELIDTEKNQLIAKLKEQKERSLLRIKAAKEETLSSLLKTAQKDMESIATETSSAKSEGLQQLEKLAHDKLPLISQSNLTKEEQEAEALELESRKEHAAALIGNARTQEQIQEALRWLINFTVESSKIKRDTRFKLEADLMDLVKKIEAESALTQEQKAKILANIQAVQEQGFTDIEKAITNQEVLTSEKKAVDAANALVYAKGESTQHLKPKAELPEQPKVSEQPQLPEQPKVSEQPQLPEEPKASEQPKQADTKGITPKLATTKQLPRTGTRTDSILVKIGSILLAMLGISQLLSVGKRQGD
ncbi:DUF1542 domain-containing protein [Streptococcus suis]|uniref:DUF1542 domain-containing protein n=1 Tax=Streptococcus suis TaxID=1307 RepID=UPI0005CCC619|nr:DUF1542 domain-containing protein [Streptococcus suis]NQI08772.1 DUF1542 domain-containing protein [Streptococcus suis]CYU66710.1 choline-binding surface protein A [Streptococcus suis]